MLYARKTQEFNKSDFVLYLVSFSEKGHTFIFVYTALLCLLYQ